MIAKKTTGSNIRGAVNYVTQAHKMAWLQERNIGDTAPAIIADDMEYVTGKSSKTQKPVYHISMSWSRDDHPTKQQMIEVADDFLRHMKLDDHQSIIVAHNDRDHPHMHLVINRVHPETGKAWEPYLYEGQGRDRSIAQTDYSRIEKYLRATEKQYGWKVTPGKHAGQSEKAFEGKAPELWEIKHQAKSEKVAQGIGIDNVDLRPIKERAQALKEKLYQATSFQEFDKVLARNGLWITADGQGASITDGNYKVKASSVSRGLSGPKLEQRFGQNLKEYDTHRAASIDTGKAERQLQQWGETYRQTIERKARTFTGRKVDVLSGQARQLAQYSSEIAAAQRDLEAGFSGAYSEGRAAYGQFREMTNSAGYDEAVEELVSNPERFGQVNDPSSIVDAADALRRTQQINNQYSTYLQQMSKSERKEKLSTLNGKVQKWKQLQSSLTNPIRSGMRKTEGGQALQRSTADLISMAKATGQLISQPGKNPMQGGINTLHRVTAAMDSDGGQVAGRILQNASRHIKLATQMLSNPTNGSLKIIKNIIQSSTRSISKAGREAGRSL